MFQEIELDVFRVTSLGYGDNPFQPFLSVYLPPIRMVLFFRKDVKITQQRGSQSSVG